MRRVVEFDGQRVIVQQEAAPKPNPDEVLIQLRLAGICSTDLALMRGYKDFHGMLGHEFVGEVISGPDTWLGQRVVGEINIGCGVCDMCQRGLKSHCRQRRALGIFNYDGAFGDVFRLPVANLHRVPDSVSDRQAVFVEPLAAAAQILQQIHIQPQQRVVVIGLGRLGLLVVQVLAHTTAEVTGVVRHERQVALLRQWGINASRVEDVPLAQADVVVDCTGDVEGFHTALALVRPRGTLVLKSTYEGLSAVELTKVAVNEITVVGSRCGPFPVAIRLLAHSRIDVESMIDGVYLLEEASQALTHAGQSGTLKILLKP
ncbi:MAG: alcohol dehydrogenase catalytic domain-containing protein [Anaerolineales bacterium]|nr:alcohol dehydrogenase catalytic domain-containing protein [Anaerolineales bacterium]